MKTELLEMTDAQLIVYCSNRAEGNELVHALCDRLTHRHMQMVAVQQKLTEVVSLSSPTDP